MPTDKASLPAYAIWPKCPALSPEQKGVMASNTPTPSDFVDARLQRAARRLQNQDHTGALDDLRAVLEHLRCAGTDPDLLQTLADLVDRDAGGLPPNWDDRVMPRLRSAPKG